MRLRTLYPAVFAALLIALIGWRLTAWFNVVPSKGLPVHVAQMPSNCGDGRVFVLQIFGDGLLKINSEMVTSAGLEDQLREVFRTRAERLLIVKADGDVPFQTVAETIETGRRQADYVALMTPSLEKELAARPLKGLAVCVGYRDG